MRTPLWFDDMRSRVRMPQLPSRRSAASKPAVAPKPAAAVTVSGKANGNGNGRGRLSGNGGNGPMPGSVGGPDPELIAQRDRLIEKLTVMQCDLGGAFYEMAIRDHVRLDALTAKAAELQVVDTELAQVERAIELQVSGVAGRCPSCAEPHGAGVAFCSQCGHALVQTAGAEPAGAQVAAASNGAAA
ncbi:MAG: hypothetical protein U0R24_02015 [Solirubrobacterales bacterium]